MSIQRESGFVSEQEPIAKSPIAQAPPVKTVGGWSLSDRRSTAALTLADRTPQAKVHIRAPKKGLAAKTIGVPFGRTERREDGTLVVGSGPGEWLVIGEIGSGAELASQWQSSLSHATESGELLTVLNLTHGRALMRLRGTASRDLLAKVCGIELSDAVIPDGAALRTSVARLTTDVVRDDQDGEPSFLLHCETSSGQYLFNSLLDAGREFGVDTQGFVPRS